MQRIHSPLGVIVRRQPPGKRAWHADSALRDRVQAVVLAYERGLVKPGGR